MSTPINKRIDLKQLATLLVSIIAAGYLLYVGKLVIVPLILSAILAILLLPVVNFLQRLRVPRVIAIIIAIVIPAVIISVVFWIFLTQFIDIFSEFPVFEEKLLTDIKEWVYSISGSINIDQAKVNESISSGIQEGLFFLSNLLKGVLVSTTTFLGFAGLVLVYVFLLLLMAPGFHTFILERLKANNYKNAEGLMLEIRAMVMGYFKGLAFVTFILATLISIGLWIIGVRHALMFGLFAALGGLVPYIGTTIGGIIPFLYALVIYEGYSKALLVVLVYQIVQILEGNFITPKVVGNSVAVNPLAAIIVLLIGGLFWGIVGMVLSIPLTALVKILMSTNPTLKPYAALLSNDFGRKEAKAAAKVE